MEARDALRATAAVAGRAATLKACGIAAVLFVVGLLVLGLIGATTIKPAAADSCGGRGTPGTDLEDLEDGKPSGGGPSRAEQKTNAKIIDKVAASGGLSGRATLIGLMVALQESSLLNLDHGHADSIGLFQQRPSQGWGTREQIMRPQYAASMFYFGDDDGDPRGLTDVPQWESKDVRTLVREVQRPAASTLDLYVVQESLARQIADQAGINLDRKGTAAPTAEAGNPGPPPVGSADRPQSPEECYPDTDGKGGAPGNPFYDGNSSWPASVKNPRSAEDAIRWARREAETGSKQWFRWCLRFVAAAYGRKSAGSRFAIGHYRSMPEEMKHDGDRNPPPGALMYWDTGSEAGHVALYLGNGKIASNDIKRVGYIDVVDATDIETKWGSTYLGWAPPYFPRGG
ncbi:peptidase M23 [Streptomyces sp. CAI 127]|uniref:peptidase M23 n=1 Tax=Streptomyces sp. CAI 127 TaxID=1076397 RepID=UPI001587621D|nr:peptidase M23 [Streptomyces sp. CAI 127]NUW02898.1 C40 family peptidase [Streptomyces sp. CAI 127]